MKCSISATLVCVTAVFSWLAGCASTTENLRLETARFLGGNVSPGQVAVTAIDRGASSVKWAAATPDGNYACGADDMVRKVSCVKQ